MNAEDHHTSYAPERGSTLQQALLFEDRERAMLLEAVYGLNEKLSALPFRFRETEPALKTLDWWQSEIDAAYAGSSRHPITQALKHTLDQGVPAREYFQELLDAQRQLILERQLTEASQIALYYHRSGGTLWLMAADICGSTSREGQRAVLSLGAHIQRLKNFFHLRRYIEHGLLILPGTLMERHDVDLRDLQQVQTPAKLQRLFQEVGRDIQTRVEADLQSIPAPERWSLRHLIIQAELYLQRLALIEEEGFRILEQETRLTPLRKTWIAWRIYRREKKAMKQDPL